MRRVPFLGSLVLVVLAALAWREGQAKENPTSAETVRADVLLDGLGKKACSWFLENRNPVSGLVRDRASNGDLGQAQSEMASIAATGFFLSLLPDAPHYGLLSPEEAAQEADRVVRFILAKAEHRDGLLYHFVDWKTGQRWQHSEISVLDSAILFNGCLVAAEAFGLAAASANALVDRADWSRYLVQQPDTGKTLLSMGWRPDSGRLLGPCDVRTSEMMMPYFLAIGSRTHPIDPQCWYNTSVRYREVAGRRLLFGELPLFTSNYGLCWAKLRGTQDRDGVDLEPIRLPLRRVRQ